MIELKHPVSGPVQVVPMISEFLELFDASVRDRIFKNISQPDVSGCVCFEVLQLDSSSRGHRQALIYGPGCTYKTAEEICAGHLGDVPSRFAYPKYIFIRGT
jgi:hypothetical protein